MFETTNVYHFNVDQVDPVYSSGFFVIIIFFSCNLWKFLLQISCYESLWLVKKTRLREVWVGLEGLEAIRSFYGRSWGS